MEILATLLLFLSSAQISFAQSFVLRGIVYSVNDSARIPFATILNQTRTTGTVTNIDGEFSLKVFPSDSIRISAVGFENFLFQASDRGKEHKSIYLTTSVQQIDTIVVRAYPPKALFKQKFMSLDLPDENPINLHLPENIMSLNLPADAREIPVHALNELPSVGMAIPFSGGTKSKVEKQKEELNQQKIVLEDIDRKYNNMLISSLTGINEDEKIVALKKFCNFSNEFILNNTPYDLASAIDDWYKEFEKQN